MPLKTRKIATLFISILAYLATGCQSFTDPKPFGVHRGMIDGAPEGTPAFRSGFKDGCTSGMAAYGSLHYKMQHDFSYDPAQLENNEYHSAWKIGFRHCRWYTAEWTRDIGGLEKGGIWWLWN